LGLGLGLGLGLTFRYVMAKMVTGQISGGQRAGYIGLVMSGQLVMKNPDLTEIKFGTVDYVG